MKELFIDIVLLSVMASMLGNFWTLCLKDGMVFGKLGENMRARVDHEKTKWGVNNMRWYIKLQKGLLCPFCVSTWIIIVIHVYYFHLFEKLGLTLWYSIFIVLFEIGLTNVFNKLTSVFINQKLKL